MHSGFKSEELNSSRKPLGNKVATGRGYQGGKDLKELIGAKKVSNPGVPNASSKGKMKY